MSRHPIQPLVLVGDGSGVLRFKANAIVRHLLDHGGIDLNALAGMEFSQDDRQQFAQLIGYSVDGYSTLSYADPDVLGAVDHYMVADVPEDKARALHLQSEMDALRDALREPIARLYGVHPDDLGAPA